MSQDVQPEFEATETESSRRSLLTKGAVAAAVATVAGLAMSKETFAGAGNGVNMTQGAANTGATITTSLAGGSTFKVSSGTSDGIGATKASIYGTTAVNGNVGVLGETSAAQSGNGVWGRNLSLTGNGVYGLNFGTNGVGVYGQHNDTTVSGSGVVGVSNFGPGLTGSGSNFDVYASGSGRVLLGQAGLLNPPTGASTVGTIARDAAGNLWYSPASGVYRKLAGTATSGSFHPISPVRVYDSRLPLPTPAPGKLLTGTNRVVSVKDGRDINTGAVTSADAVPAGATALAYNITITNTEASGGFLSVVPGDIATFSTSVINWFGPNQDLANGLIGKLDANRQIKVFCGGAGNTHFIIDVSGYFL